MLNFLKSKTAFIIAALIFVLYNVMFFTIAGVTGTLKAASIAFWLAYAFTTLAFFYIMALTFFFRLKSKNTMTTVLPFFFGSLAYLITTFIVNVVLMVLAVVLKENAQQGLTIAAVIINVILVILFSIILLIAYKSFSRVADNTEKMKKRVEELRGAAIKVNGLIPMAKDPEVKAELRHFKEDLDYSSPAGTSETADYEAQINDCIASLRMILQSDDKETAMSAIADARALLKTRNQLLMATRR